MKHLETPAPPTPEPAPPEAGGWLRRMLPFLMAHKRNVYVAFGVSILGQAVAQLLDRRLVDLAQAGPAGVVERGVPDLVEQLLEHGADPHDLGRMLDRLGLALLGFLLGPGRDDLGRYGRALAHADEPRATNGTSISAGVNDPWRHTRVRAPVSLGS